MDWQEHGAISLRVKRLATLSILVVLALSVLFGLAWPILLIQAVVLSLVLLFIWTRPNC